MPPSAASRTAGPAAPTYPIAAILKWLFAEYGAKAGFPAQGEAERSNKLVALTRLARGTVADLFIDRARTVPPWRKTCEKLAECFRRAVPGIQWDWFRATTVEEFQGLVARSSADWKSISITVPRTSVCPLEDLRTLPGYYVTYRFSIDRSQNRHVAREVIEITEKDDAFRFRMSFRTGGEGEEDGKLMRFEGVVLPVGQSLCFFGWEARRVRTLLFRWDGDSPKTPFHLGMMTSTKRGMPYYPIAACTIMIKLADMPDEEEEFVKQATQIAPFESLIAEDFGSEALGAMRVFLDNSISMIRADGNAPEESVLRINEDRFMGKMPDIHKEALARKKAPFVPNWRPSREKAETSRGRRRKGASGRKADGTGVAG